MPMELKILSDSDGKYIVAISVVEILNLLKIVQKTPKNDFGGNPIITELDGDWSGSLPDQRMTELLKDNPLEQVFDFDENPDAKFRSFL